MLGLLIPLISTASAINSLGCYVDSSTSRTLPYAYYASSTAMTVEACSQHCSQLGYRYSGVEYYRECFCGSSLDQTRIAPSTDCSLPCTGNTLEVCGGNLRISVSEEPIIPSGALPVALNSLGCYVDSISRILPYGYLYSATSMTVESCAQHCSQLGYRYSGVENANQCFCGSTLDQTKIASATDCNMPCSGNGYETCGGGWRLSVSEDKNIPFGNTPSALNSLGCYTDAVARTLPFGFISSQSYMTVEACAQHCSSQNYRYSGVENWAECYCGNTLDTTKVAPSTDCSIICSGNYAETCGGIWRLSVTEDQNVQVGALPPINAKAVSVGCYMDTYSVRTLPLAAFSSSSMTIEQCVNYCNNQNLPYAGLEYGNTCYCASFLNSSLQANPSECNFGCSGNNFQPCGASLRLNVYQNPNIPTGAVAPVQASVIRLGCFTDNYTYRTLPLASTSSSTMTVEKCATFCTNNNLPYSGVQYGTYCYCGNYLDTSRRTNDLDCNMYCAGNVFQGCGADLRMNVYQNPDLPVSAVAPAAGNVCQCSSSC